MPTSSKRKNAIAQLVTVLAAVTSGADYFNTFSGDQQVAATFDGDDARMAVPHNPTLRIRDAQEVFQRNYANRGAGTDDTATLHLMVDVLMRHQTGDGANIVNELQDIFHDIRLAIDKNPTLNNAVNDAMVDQITPPIYDTVQNLAAAEVRVRVTYDYEPSVTT